MSEDDRNSGAKFRKRRAGARFKCRRFRQLVSHHGRRAGCCRTVRIPTRRLDAEIRFSVFHEERAELAQLAQSNDRTLAGEVRRAVRLYLASLRQRARPSAGSGAQREPCGLSATRCQK
jgi:hypothetical protein